MYLGMGNLHVILRCRSQNYHDLIFLLGGVVVLVLGGGELGQKVVAILGESEREFWASVSIVLGTICSFKKCGLWEGFRKLGISDFND